MISLAMLFQIKPVSLLYVITVQLYYSHEIFKKGYLAAPPISNSFFDRSNHSTVYEYEKELVHVARTVNLLSREQIQDEISARLLLLSNSLTISISLEFKFDFTLYKISSNMNAPTLTHTQVSLR